MLRPLPLPCDARSDPEGHCARVRWPGGEPDACPRCGAPGPRPVESKRWRCRACARYFTVTTGTPIQGSRVPLAGWIEAAEHWWAPGEIHRRLGVSYPTARRMARLLARTDHQSPQTRLADLLKRDPSADSEDCESASHGAAWGDEFELLPFRHRQAVQALAALYRGASAGRIAEYTGMTSGHARRCMKALEARGLVRCEVQAVLCGYKLVDHNIWDFATEELRMEAMRLPFLAPRPQPPPASVPVEFWWALWSEPTADRIDLTDEDDCLAAAARLVACPHPAPKNWALMALPLTVLRKLRAVRGYDRGEIAQAIDSAIAARANADDDH